MYDLTYNADDHTYWLGGGLQQVPGVSEIIRDAGVGADYSQVPARVLEAAAQRGRAVHAAVEQLEATGIAPELPVPWRGYLDSWQRWRDAVRWEADGFESLVYSPVYGGYAGRCDLHGDVDGAPAVLDMKARATKPGERDLWQVAAYGYALYGGAPPPRRIVLHLQQDGGIAKALEGENWGEEWGTFELLLRMWHLRKRMKGKK